MSCNYARQDDPERPLSRLIGRHPVTSPQPYSRFFSRTRVVIPSYRATARASRKAAMLAVFAAFERVILQGRTRASLAHTRQNSRRLGRPATVAAHAAEIRTPLRAGVSKSEIARRVRIGRTSVRRILTVRRGAGQHQTICNRRASESHTLCPLGS